MSGNDLVIAEKEIMSQENRFKELAEIHGAVNFKAEAEFAMQAMQNNDFLLSTAMKNKDSLLNAVVNVASIGLTLNPAHKRAYLVPRNGHVCLDISYMGYIHLACETGSILWVSAELVHKNDEFTAGGPGVRPTHKFNAFGDRGEIVGSYCMAKTRDNEYLTTIMSIKDIYSIRNRSASWNSKNGPSGPWKTDEGEMIKKTVIKRAAKMWPKIERNDRLSIAIENENKADPIDFSKPDEVQDLALLEKLNLIISKIGGSTEEKLKKHIKDHFKRNVETTNDFTNEELLYSVKFLEPYSLKKKTDIVTVQEVVKDAEKELEQPLKSQDKSKEIDDKNKTKVIFNPQHGHVNNDQISKMVANIPWEDEKK